MSNTFYNTTEITGSEKDISVARAHRQEQTVKRFFIKNKGQMMSPEHVWKELQMDKDGVPLTSVRRAITNLTAQGVLLKTKNKVRSELGGMCHLWTYNTFNDDNIPNIFTIAG